MRRRIAPAVACALVLVGAPSRARAESAAASFAEQAPTQADQCYILVELCHAANVAIDRTERTPPGRDVLAFQQEGKAELAVDDALAAAEVIERRNGKRLACFDDPECRGILPKPKPRH
jgi:hypothetical protein